MFFDNPLTTWPLALGVIPYALPWLVATFRQHRNRGSITVINLLLGSTVLGWIVALAWAFSGQKEA
jgi:hypothetical protein